MSKKIIKLTESKLRHIIEETVNDILKKNNIISTTDKKLFPLKLDGITKQDVEEIFVDYTLIHTFPNYSNPINKLPSSDEQLVEDVKKTIPLKDAKKFLLQKYPLKDWQFQIHKASNNIEIAIVVPQINVNDKQIIKDMEQMGYFYSVAVPFYMYNMPMVRLQFEPLFQDNITNEVKNMNIIYHVTPTSNVNSILLYGFLPSSKNNKFKYPNRVYFIKGNTTPNDIIEVVKMLASASNRNPLDYSIFILNVSSLDNDLEFNYDPNFIHGVFTHDIIDKKYISGVISAKEFAENNFINFP